jgi:hypothetical protein
MAATGEEREIRQHRDKLVQKKNRTHLSVSLTLGILGAYAFTESTFSATPIRIPTDTRRAAILHSRIRVSPRPQA